MQKQQERAILVNVIPPEVPKDEAMAEFDELVRLVETYGGIVIVKILQRRGRPSAKTFVGEGKANEIATLVKDLNAQIVVINGFLKANQSNHLVNIIPCEVLDRFEMILKIFEKHATSPEAKLQLQIAQFKYEFPKLFGKGAVLSQQKTGIGGLRSGAGRKAARGPGEKILEVKRRYLRDHIKTMERKLDQFRRVREMQRERRRRNEFLTVALVGYTNSGKSSLLTALTKKQNILVEDKLFSTLDTRLGELYLPPQNGNLGQVGYSTAKKILLADTIGFVKNLPPLLFSSFLATLEEVKEADLLLHVVDSADAKAVEKIRVVENIIDQLGCGKKLQIMVFNKIDLATSEVLESLRTDFAQREHAFVSALRRENLNTLLNKIRTYLQWFHSTTTFA